MTELCWPPNCVRVEGHTGDCRRAANIPLCGAWMVHNQEPCARYAGHSWDHRSRYALDNNRDAKIRAAARRAA